MPHWIHLEFKSNGNKTGAIQLDLERISRVQYVRENKKIIKIVLRYDGRENIGLEDKHVIEHFPGQWDDYIAQHQGRIHYRSDEQEPGTIQTAAPRRSEGNLIQLS